MYRGVMGPCAVILSVTLFVCVSTLPDRYSSDSTSQQHLLRLAKVLNALRKLEISGKGTLSQAVRHQRISDHGARDYRPHTSSRSKSRLRDQNEAEQYKNLESYMASNQDGGDVLSKRQGNWDYDYGLGGGRFGKRNPGDYGIGGGRFGRDVADVDHVDLADAE